ncbi:E3 ubiquitin-protein ligase UBR2-like [Amphibalanus amphitrite]|uniref:E3 ubiquitin-protein ligase UBR2-like n=1 Tax=Amphibalanus amphitrite TaxID=1232801 RepID=UPI001C8FB1DB|nr:E3 ubiquitin-protein ligase UBR2-like [Amphibalanus amphitrite]
MAEADYLATPVQEWAQLFERQALTTELIREFWKESVPRLTVPPPAAPVEEQTAFEDQRHRLLLRPLSRFLLGDDAVDGEESAPPPSQVCGKVFNNGDPTYSCRDCAQDPTCVLCTECFRQSVHRYHRYQMCVSQGNGGFCDCGDFEAWKGDPTCSSHKPPPPEQRPTEASPEQAGKASVLFSAAMQYMLSVFDRDASTLKIVPLELDLGREHYPARNQRYATMAYNFGVTATDKVADTVAQVTPCSQEEARAAATALKKEGAAILLYNDITGCDELLKRLKPEQSRKLRRAELHVVHAHVAAHQLFTLRLVRHLREMLERRPTLRPLFNTVMQQTVGGSELMPSMLERVMACDGRQWKQARHETHLLLIQGMLMDMESKKYFAQMFTARYREQTLASLPSSMQDQITVQDLSVQIYTVPSIAHHLMAEQDALAVVIGTLVDELRTHTHGGQLVLRPVTSDSAARRRFECVISCLTDAKYLLSVVPPTQSDKLRAGVRRGLDMLLELLYFCEGMEPVVRAQTAHVLYDPQYELQMTLSFSLAPLVNQVLEWCASDRQLLVYAYSAVLSKLHSRLPPDKYFQRCEVLRFGRRLSVSPLSVMTMPVSLELPLSRLLAGLHLHLAAHGLSYNSSEFASLEDRVTPAQMLERPLRALVVDAQVQSGLWRRNGRWLEIMCSWYSLPVQVADMRDRDLQVAQICASLMDPDEFVATLLFRHGAADTDGTLAGEHGEALPEDDPEGERREHMDSNMADLLLLLLHVFAERYHPGVGQVTKEQCLENEVIQFLCVKPMTHSQVAKQLSEADSGMLEAAVKRVADFATQQDFRGQLTYHIKPEYTHRYTPMWHHFSRHYRSQSEQRLRRLRRQRGESACLPPPAAPPFQPALRPARAILTCDVTLQVLLQQLNRMFDAPFAASLELILLRSLFLIGTALNEEEREANTDEPEPFCFSGPAQRVGLVDVLQKLVGNPRVSPHADLLAWVNTKLNRLLGRTAAASDSQAAASEDAGSEQKRRRAKAAALRSRILGQMQAQQKKFISENMTALAEPEEAEPSGALSAERAAAVTGSAMDLSEGAEPDRWPVCLGPRQSARPAAPAEYTCILCQATEQVSSTRPAMVMAAFVQLSTVLSRDRASTAANPVLYVPSSLHRLPHTSSCGHAMHAACWQRHFDSVARDRRAHPRVQYLSSFDVQRHEFLCPLCLRLSNTVIPVVAEWGGAAPVPAAAATVDHIDVWLSGLMVACGPVRGGGGTEEDPCSCCDPDWADTLTAAVGCQLTERESELHDRQIQREGI